MAKVVYFALAKWMTHQRPKGCGRAVLVLAPCKGRVYEIPKGCNKHSRSLCLWKNSKNPKNLSHPRPPKGGYFLKSSQTLAGSFSTTGTSSLQRGQTCIGSSPTCCSSSVWCSVPVHPHRGHLHSFSPSSECLYCISPPTILYHFDFSLIIKL